MTLPRADSLCQTGPDEKKGSAGVSLRVYNTGAELDGLLEVPAALE